MIEQIYSPVRWVECVNNMVVQGITTTLECGPGKVLSGLIKKINPEITIKNIERLEEIENLM